MSVQCISHIAIGFILLYYCYSRVTEEKSHLLCIGCEGTRKSIVGNAMHFDHFN